MSVLIIEDDHDIRETLKELLVTEGYAVLTAENGKEGIEVLKTGKRPRLVLLDLMMPVMGGIEFLDILTKDAVLASIPVYIHSATADMTLIKGARGLLKKPASFDSIIELVQSYCD